MDDDDQIIRATAVAIVAHAVSGGSGMSVNATVHALVHEAKRVEEYIRTGA